MPLIQSKSKKALSKNIEIEMKHGKPQKQSIAIAYDIKRKNAKKKMAEGGPISVKAESRPMPSSEGVDKSEISHNSSKHKLTQDKMLSRPDIMQSEHGSKPKLQPINDMSMAKSSIIKAHKVDALGRRLDQIEKHLMGHDVPKLADGGDVERGDLPQAQEEAQHDEDAAHEEHDEDMYAEGGMALHDADHEGDVHHKAVDHEYGDGAEEDMDPSIHPGDGDDMEMSPPVDEYMAKRMARGGMAHEMDDIDVEEMEDEKHSSIAAAIMAKKHAGKQPKMMAEGGEVDLDHNAEEEPNHEDDESFEALKKENYDESDGLKALHDPMDASEHGDDREMDEENKKDMINAIRSKMKSRKQF